MADTVTSPRGAEISERSVELVLPDDDTGAAPLRKRREFGVSESEGTTAQVLRDREGEARGRGDAPGKPPGSPSIHSSAALAGGLTSNGVTTAAPAPSAGPTTGLANSLTTPPGAAAPDAPPSAASTVARDTPPSPPRAAGPEAPPAPDATAAKPPKPPEPRGVALPGDRGPRNQAAQPQRPSFWRRIALGRRTPTSETETHVAPPDAQTQPAVPAAPERPSLAERAKNAVVPAPAIDTQSIENVIVEPMLQALVSVEAKLERSHVELVGRSDVVEQRLTQLWDIEEQLGTLGELQESLLQVSEQQRRLETAVVSQTKTLRWLVGAVFFSLAAAAFVVAAVLR